MTHKEQPRYWADTEYPYLMMMMMEFGDSDNTDIGDQFKYRTLSA